MWMRECFVAIEIKLHIFEVNYETVVGRGGTVLCIVVAWIDRWMDGWLGWLHEGYTNMQAGMKTKLVTGRLTYI